MWRSCVEGTEADDFATIRSPSCRDCFIIGFAGGSRLCIDDGIDLSYCLSGESIVIDVGGDATISDPF